MNIAEKFHIDCIISCLQQNQFQKQLQINSTSTLVLKIELNQACLH